MAGLRQECDYMLLQYVPDPVRNEFVHVGVILRDSRGRVASVRMTSDWRRAKCLNPDVDTEYFELLGSELRRRFQEEPDGNLMHVLEDSFSNSVQVTRAKAFSVESVEAGVEDLMRMYVEPPKRERQGGRAAGRAGIQAAMQTEFQRAGVWDLLRKRIAASEYTRVGDPLKIDLGYRSSIGLGTSPAGVIRMFHAVSLEAGVEMAKVLAFSANDLMTGVQRVDRVALELTAVVEPLRGLEKQGTGNGEQGAGAQGRGTKGAAGRGSGLDGLDFEAGSERVEAYRFAVDTMEEHRIRVLTTADLGRVAETARRELRV